MSFCRHLRRVIDDGIPRHAWGQSGAQMVEFAVSLPLLVVFVVGIFDFSGAFTLKQKLTNTARDAARTAAAGPSNDLGNTNPAAAPASVTAAFQVVTNYFLENQLNSCGISTTPGAPSNLTWTYTGNAAPCPAGGLKVIINRGYYFPASTSTQVATANCAVQAPGTQTAVLSTCVTIQYAYQWRFGRVASLLGASATLPPTITATAVAMNEN